MSKRNYKFIAVKPLVGDRLSSLRTSMISYNDVIEFLLTRCGYLSIDECTSDPHLTQELVERYYKEKEIK